MKRPFWYRLEDQDLRFRCQATFYLKINLTLFPLDHRQRLVIITGPHRTQKTTAGNIYREGSFLWGGILFQKKKKIAISVVHSGRFASLWNEILRNSDVISIDRRTASLKLFGNKMLLEEFRIRGEKWVIGAPNLRLLFAPNPPIKKYTNLHKSA